MPRNGGGVRNALLPIMHPSTAIVYRHRVVLDEFVLMRGAKAADRREGRAFARLRASFRHIGHEDRAA
jgi:hypothetical protein